MPMFPRSLDGSGWCFGKKGLFFQSQFTIQTWQFARKRISMKRMKVGPACSQRTAVAGARS